MVPSPTAKASEEHDAEETPARPAREDRRQKKDWSVGAKQLACHHRQGFESLPQGELESQAFGALAHSFKFFGEPRSGAHHEAKAKSRIAHGGCSPAQQDPRCSAKWRNGFSVTSPKCSS